MTPAWKQSRWLTTRMLLEGIALGAVYGFILRYLLRATGVNTSVYAIMSLAFLFLGPVVIGFLTIQRASKAGPVAVWQWIFAPWLSILLACAAALLFALEGMICVAFALPIALLGASVGGVIGGSIPRGKRNLSGSATVCIAVLPMLLAPLESRVTPPLQIHTVSSEIRIHASTATVWRNIERVPAIAPAELRNTWAQRIGFPRPVEATLSYEGVGGVRHASFEHGLLFFETVTAWQPQSRLAFTIKADTAHIPPTTLDEHVTIGGRYFDVLDGEYRLEPLPNGDVLLHLTSHQRISTDFNGYAGFWSDTVMQSLQTSILQVIQHRCEQA